MSGIEFKVNQTDLKRIAASLNNMSSASVSHKYKWTYEILKEYENTVTTAMGSVSGKGGSTKMHYSTYTESRYWNPLADATVQAYALESGRFGGSHDLDSDMLRSVFKIWRYTGDTSKLVHVSLNPNSNFVGIDGRNPKALKDATTLEEGGSSDWGGAIPSRKLFSVANKLFVTAIKNAMNNKDSYLYKHLTDEFIQAVAINGAKWVNV